MKRFSALILLGYLFLSCGESTAPTVGVDGDKPNILLVSLDTLRFDSTSLAGGTPATPFLNELARRGVHFRTAYSTHDLTTRSHFSMLTGFSDGWQTELDQPFHSLPAQLKSLGYVTFAAVANANLRREGNPYLMSFDQFVCLYDVWQGLDSEQRRIALDEIDARIRHYDAEPNEWSRLLVYSSWAQLRPRFAQQLDNASAPFFGFLNLLDSHDPFFPDPAAYDRAEERPPHDFAPDLRHREIPYWLSEPETIEDPEKRRIVEDRIEVAQGRAWSTTLDLRPSSVETYRLRYDAEVRELDAALREIFDILETRDLIDSTVVIITSDHGEAFGEEDLLTHAFDNRSAREATHRVPLLWVFPSRMGIPPAERDEFVTIADIPPTIYDLLGIDWVELTRQTEPGNYGRSLYPFLSHRKPLYTATVVREEDPLTVSERSRSRSEAEQSLKALGYMQ